MNYDEKLKSFLNELSDLIDKYDVSIEQSSPNIEISKTLIDGLGFNFENKKRFMLVENNILEFAGYEQGRSKWIGIGEWNKE